MGSLAITTTRYVLSASKRVFARCTVATLFLAHALPSAADGSSIGQIYAPYVQPLEQELELVFINDNRGDNSDTPSSDWQKLGYGTSLLDNIYTELSVTRRHEQQQSLHVVELEGIWQLSEQGEYDSDWGALFELEIGLERDARELSLGILNSRDFGKFTLLSNALIAVEWGSDINDEIETALAMQLRYRCRPAVEPTLELFVAQDTLAIGPGLGGIVRLQGVNQLRWNASVLQGFADDADISLKLELEYEFF